MPHTIEIGPEIQIDDSCQSLNNRLNDDSDTVSVTDTATNTVVETIPVGVGPVAVAITPAPQTPTSKEYCKHDGYLKFGPPAGPFKNQGQCVSYVEHHWQGRKEVFMQYRFTVTEHVRGEVDDPSVFRSPDLANRFSSSDNFSDKSNFLLHGPSSPGITAQRAGNHECQHCVDPNPDPMASRETGREWPATKPCCRKQRLGRS